MGVHKIRGNLPTRLELAAEMLGAYCPSKLLEIGCGTGALIRHLALCYEAISITGIDRSAKMISAASERLNDLLITGRLTLQVHSLEQEPFATFPLIVAVDVNAFWTKPSEAFRFLGTWLAPNGAAVLIFSAPSRAKLDEILQRIGTGNDCSGLKVHTGISTCRGDLFAFALVNQTSPNEEGVRSP